MWDNVISQELANLYADTIGAVLEAATDGLHCINSAAQLRFAFLSPPVSVHDPSTTGNCRDRRTSRFDFQIDNLGGVSGVKANDELLAWTARRSRTPPPRRRLARSASVVEMRVRRAARLGPGARRRLPLGSF